MFCFLTSEMSVHENNFSLAKGERGTKKKNIETHDFSTPTEWNVKMVQNKVIVTLKGGGEKMTRILVECVVQLEIPMLRSTSRI